MKVGGVEVTSCEEFLVLPRSAGDDLVFRAKAVNVNDEFDKMAPEPIAPNVRTKDGSRPDLKDEHYLRAVQERDQQRFAYMCLKSLEPSNIEWDTIDMDKPQTWTKWTEELKESGLSEIEVGRIINIVLVANSLDEKKIEEARKAFLLGQGA
jgi:hypothetical protein